jgi:septum formation protein
MSEKHAGLTDIPIVLASGSPRRIELLRAHGIEPIIRPPDVDESIPLNLNVRQAVMYLALKKAFASAETCGALFEDARDATPFIIAADTVVFKDRIFGKPASREEAYNMLDALRNSRHTVYTGVAILRGCSARAGRPAPDSRIPGGAQADTRRLKRVFCEATHVFFKDYSRSDIEAYIESGEPFDKAGAYAVQGGFGIHVDRMEGDVSNVMGFPWDRIERELVEMLS